MILSLELFLILLFWFLTEAVEAASGTDAWESDRSDGPHNSLRCCQLCSSLTTLQVSWKLSSPTLAAIPLVVFAFPRIHSIGGFRKWLLMPLLWLIVYRLLFLGHWNVNSSHIRPVTSNPRENMYRHTECAVLTFVLGGFDPKTLSSYSQTEGIDLWYPRTLLPTKRLYLSLPLVSNDI